MPGLLPLLPGAKLIRLAFPRYTRAVAETTPLLGTCEPAFSSLALMPDRFLTTPVSSAAYCGMCEKPRACKTIDDLSVGDRIERPYIITDEDLRKFAELSDDWNPLHFDEEYAASTMFKRRIAHGLISLAKFSGIFGMDMPGLGTLWETQDVRFIAPVHVGESYKAVAEVTNKDRRRATVATWVEDEFGKRVLEGTAVVIPISAAVRKTIAPDRWG